MKLNDLIVFKEVNIYNSYWKQIEIKNLEIEYGLFNLLESNINNLKIDSFVIS